MSNEIQDPAEPGHQRVPVSEPAPVPVEAETEVSEQPSEAPVQNIVYGTSPHVTLFSPVFIKQTKSLSFKEHERLAAFGATAKEVAACGETYADVKLGTDEATMNWAAATGEADRHLVNSDVYEDTFNRASNWSNSVKADGLQLHVGKPMLEKNSGTPLVGEAALMRIQAVMGLGSTARIPLWHSGLWLTLKAPSDTALLELERRIATDKVNLGRSTDGLVFSSSGVFIRDTVVDFILAHVMEATYRYSDVSELKSIIDITDVDLMVHGVLCTIYPNGYPYSQPCVVNPVTCTHITHELLSIPRILFVDQMRLTEKQLKHMTMRGAKFTPTEVAAYKAEHPFLASRRVELTPQVSLLLRVPSIEQSRQIGTSWVNGITTKVERSFAASIPAKEREEYIVNQARVTSMSQYAHWVEKILIADGEGNEDEISDPTAITETLGVMSSNEGAYKAYYDGVQKFVSECTIAVVALPKQPCPKCQKEHEATTPEELRHPHLLPLDVVNVFFTLLGHRLTKIFSNDA